MLRTTIKVINKHYLLTYYLVLLVDLFYIYINLPSHLYPLAQ